MTKRAAPETTQNPVAKRHRVGDGNSDYRTPTVEEIEMLATGTTATSSLFSLKVDALLEARKVKYAKLQSLESALRILKDVFETAAAVPDKSISDAMKFMKERSIVIPFAEPPSPDAQYQLAFAPPSRVSIIGSFLLRANIRTKTAQNVDMAVEMPKTLFQEKDYLRFRYHHKRAYYLAALADEVHRNRKKLPEFEMRLAAPDGDRWRPVLELHFAQNPANTQTSTSKGKGTKTTSQTADHSVPKDHSSSFVLRIHPTIDHTTFPHTRLAPSRDNLRTSTTTSSQPVEPAATSPGDHPTPVYNASILRDMLPLAHLNHLHAAIKLCPAMLDAIILGKIWLRQRGVNAERTGFSGFLWSMLVAWVVNGRGSGSGGAAGTGAGAMGGASALQLFRMVVEVLAHRDFVRDPIVMTKDGNPLDVEEFSLPHFASAYHVTILDPTGRLNLAANMTSASLASLQHDARVTFETLGRVGDDERERAFDHVFLDKVDDEWLKWDAFIRVPKASSLKSKAENHDLYRGPNLQISNVSSVLSRALKARVHLVDARIVELHPSWAIASPPPKHQPSVTIGFLVNAAEWSNVIEMGPSADSDLFAAAGSSEFSQLWGDKCTVRRFQDGAIRECVVWDGQVRNSAGGVLGAMVSWLIKKHWGIEASFQHFDSLNDLFRNGSIWNQDGFQTVVDAFDGLSRDLRAISDQLPLGILSVSGASSSLRYAAAAIPEAGVKNTTPIHVVCEMEHSTRWPDDLEAIQAMKLALYVKIAELLQKRNSDYKAVVATSLRWHGAPQLHPLTGAITASGCLEVTTAGALLFRIQIYTERELILLQRAGDDNSRPADQKEAYRNHQSVYPALGLTMRLVKRWVASQMLSSLLSEELVELLCLSVFVNSRPWSPPGTGVAGFYRVLNLLATRNFQESPVFVELEQGKMTQELLQDIVLASKESAKNGTRIRQGYLSVATEVDPSGYLWCDPACTLGWFIASRVAQLAKEASSVILDVEGNVQTAFELSESDFDTVIHLDPRHVKNYFLNLRRKELPSQARRYKNLELATERDFAAFDAPQEFVYELQDAFRESALVFWDYYGGDRVGILWNQLVMKRLRYRTTNSYSTVPVVDQNGNMTGEVDPNKIAMLVEILQSGNGGIVIGASSFV
ncbi:hypothetical protein HDU93_009011 [Gonapodya sp. JEL0774]|nr:hypothetical protein HDU93_009011 [Gonapodya sp. JEL0774]